MELCLNLTRALKESGHRSSSGQDDHRQTGRGAGCVYIYIKIYACESACVSMRVPEWGVVDMFTMGNEPISRLPRGKMWGCLSGEWGLPPHPSLSKMWVTSHPRVILLCFGWNNDPPAAPKPLIKSLTH